MKYESHNSVNATLLSQGFWATKFYKLFELHYSFLIPSVYFKTILLDKIEKLLPNWDQWKLDALWTALNKIII